MPTAARVYIASMLVLMLLMVAMHFAIQVWSQHKAEQWVKNWEQAHQGHVGDVRLRMLRGALTLRDVHWQSADVRMDIPFVLLRGNVSADMPDIRIWDVEVRDAHFTLPESTLFKADWMPWMSLLAEARDVRGENIDIRLMPSLKNGWLKSPLDIKKVNFASLRDAKTWQLSGHSLEGLLGVNCQNNDIFVTATGIQANHLSQVLGLTAIEGVMDGDVHWQQGKWSGETQWHGLEGREGKLVWHGKSDVGKAGESMWQSDVHALDWPLQLWQKQVPILVGRRLQQGYLNGVLHVKGNAKAAWQLVMDEGEVRQVIYQKPAVLSDSDSWKVGSLNMSGLALQWPSRLLSVRELQFNQSYLPIDSYATLTDSNWQLVMPAMQFQALQLVDVKNNYRLPMLKGSAAWQSNILSFDAVNESDQYSEDRWHLTANGALNQLQVQLKATDVPMISVRNMLPGGLVREARLEGEIDLLLKGEKLNKGWHLGGDIQARDVVWEREGWLWNAASMQLHDVALSDSHVPVIKRWDIVDWAVQAPLKPWTLDKEGLAKKAAPQDFLLAGLEVEALHLERGALSLGQKDAVWLALEAVDALHVQPEKVINIKADGGLSGGVFSTQLQFFPWQENAWFEGQVRVENALPFVAKPWLELSHLPLFRKGRISMDMTLETNKENGRYEGMLALNMKHISLQRGALPNSPLLAEIGYAPQALLERVADDGNVEINVPLRGDWQERPLQLSAIGHGILAALAEKAAKPKKNKMHIEEVSSLSNIRLHNISADSLQYNERVRLRKVLRVLNRNKAWKLELLPQIGKYPLNADLQERIQRTQQLIESFLIERGIALNRIFPVWADESQRSGESTGIRIQAVK